MIDEQIVKFDEFGKEYVLDEFGNKIPPLRTTVSEKTISGWTIFDTSQGHCALCGRLTCNGNCFK